MSGEGEVFVEMRLQRESQLYKSFEHSPYGNEFLTLYFTTDVSFPFNSLSLFQATTADSSTYRSHNLE